MDFDDLAKGTRVKEIADELRQWISFDAAIEMLAVYMIAEEVNTQIMDEVQESANKLGVLAKAVSQERTELVDFPGPAIRLVNASLASLAKVGTGLSKVRTGLSKAGKQGAAAKNLRHKELKAWALKEAETMHASHIDIARTLAALIPAHLTDVSRDPERLIYDALRKIKKPD